MPQSIEREMNKQDHSNVKYPSRLYVDLMHLLQGRAFREYKVGGEITRRSQAIIPDKEPNQSNPKAGWVGKRVRVTVSFETQILNMTEYLIRPRTLETKDDKEHIAHIWTGLDTACKMVSNKQINIKKYKVFPNTQWRRVCFNCLAEVDA